MILSSRCILLPSMLLFCLLRLYGQEVRDSSRYALENSPTAPPQTSTLKPNGLPNEPYDLLHLADDIARIWRQSGRRVRKEIKKFNAIDTVYIAPNKYNLAFMLERSYWYENVRLGGNTAESRQSIAFSPNPDMKVGIYFGWRWLFLGYTFDLNDVLGKNEKKKNKKEFALSIYSSKFGVDLYYRKTGSNFKIRSYQGFDIPNEQRRDPNRDFDGLQCRIKGIDAYWIFNYKRFSYPAVYSQSTNQKRSTGSLMAGFSYSLHHYLFDPSRLPYLMRLQLNEAMHIGEIKYSNYSLNFGYGYNWVFAKHCAANLSLLPAIGYKKSKIFAGKQGADEPSLLNFKWLKKVNLDLIGRAGIVWNDSKHFVGASVVTHTYNYRKESFTLTNSFATLRIYAGFNFWKR